jgi:hypothetical protein
MRYYASTATMPQQKLVTYFMRSALVGGCLGAAHGAAVMHKHQLPTIEPIVMHGATGLFLGPWAPVALPIWIWKQPDVHCPANPREWSKKRGPPPSSVDGGVATKDLERVALDGHF